MKYAIGDLVFLRGHGPASSINNRCIAGIVVKTYQERWEQRLFTRYQVKWQNLDIERAWYNSYDLEKP